MTALELAVLIMSGGLQMLTKGAAQILIADNDEDVLIALEHKLETGGYSTLTALNRAETWKLLSEHTVDLCVLDDYLSDKNSAEVLHQLRETGKRTLVIVTYHRFPDPRVEKQFRALGVNAFVNKGAHSELVDIVSHLLEPMKSGPRSAFDELT
jgi:CheY-like chemotaxis protein